MDDTGGPRQRGSASVDDTYDRDGYDDDFDAYDDFDDDGEYVRLPRRSGLLRKLLVVLVGLALFVGVLAFAAVSYVQSKLDPPGEPGAAVQIEVPEGYSVSATGTLLADEGIVSDATIFRYYARYKDFASVDAGLYELQPNSAMWDVLEALAAGPLPPSFTTVTIPEGLRIDEVAARLLDQMPSLDRAELLSALAGVETSLRPEGQASLEGLLFPSTYRIEEGDEADEAKIVAQMVSELEAVTAELGYDQAQALTGRSPYELLVIASLIEEEARVPEDQAKISRVIHNRLEQGMKLEIDATVLFARGTHTDTLTQSDLEIDSPYNTRRYPGLPPTPIALPGRGALEAALHPAEGDWLFYVLADAEGHHLFTSDYDEFLRQKRASQDAGLF
jgi:UPF0755 protein